MKDCNFTALEDFHNRNIECEFTRALYLNMEQAFKNQIITYIRRNDYVELKAILKKVKPSNTELTKYLIECAAFGGHRGFQTLIAAGANPTGFEFNNEPFFKALTNHNNEILNWYYHTLGIYKVIAEFINQYNKQSWQSHLKSVVVPNDDYLIQESAHGYLEVMCCPMNLQSDTQKFFKSNIPDIFETDPAISVLYKLVCLKY